MLNTYTEISLKISMLLTENNAFILRSRAKVQMKAAMDKLFSLWIDCPCDLIVRGGGNRTKLLKPQNFFFGLPQLTTLQIPLNIYTTSGTTKQMCFFRFWVHLKIDLLMWNISITQNSVLI